MTSLTFEPRPEASRNLIMAPARLRVYESEEVPGALSLGLISNDRYEEVLGVLRLTPDQMRDLRDFIDATLTQNGVIR